VTSRCGRRVGRGRTDISSDLGRDGHGVDHKAFPGVRAEAVERATEYGGQLRAYRKALGASGEEVVEVLGSSADGRLARPRDGRWARYREPIELQSLL
jgi:hypothetical protein